LAISKCPGCGNSGRDLFEVVHLKVRHANHMSFVQCYKCGTVISAIDDSGLIVLHEEIQELLEKLTDK